METSRKTKYTCTNAVGSLNKEVQACGSALVIAFIFSVKQKAWGAAESENKLLVVKKNVLKIRSNEDFSTARLSDRGVWQRA